MKPVIRITLLSILVATLAAYVVVGAVWSQRATTANTCSELKIIIRDIDRREYVSAQELVSLIQKADCYPVGKKPSEWSAGAVENVVLSHPMVRTAECYLTPAGMACVSLTQREPVMRVITASDSYFIDTDRRRMPIRESVRTDVLTAEGNIGERMAREELSSFVLWIADHSYWAERITRIRVRNPHYIELVQAGSEPIIILGDLSSYRDPLRRVRKFNEEAMNKMNEPAHYRELDARFEGQIVARK